MRERGLDLLNVGVNFVIPDVKIPWGTPAFLAPHRPAREPPSRHSRGIAGAWMTRKQQSASWRMVRSNWS